MAEQKKDETVFLIVGLLAIAGWLASIGGLAFIVVHFILKFW